MSFPPGTCRAGTQPGTPGKNSRPGKLMKAIGPLTCECDRFNAWPNSCVITPVKWRPCVSLAPTAQPFISAVASVMVSS